MFKMSLAIVPLMLLVFFCGDQSERDAKAQAEPKEESGPKQQSVLKQKPVAKSAQAETTECDCPLWICDQLDELKDLWYCERYRVSEPCTIQDIVILELDENGVPGTDCETCSSPCLSTSFRDTKPKPLAQIVKDPPLSKFLPDKDALGITERGTCMVEFPVSAGSQTMLRVKLFVLEGNPAKATSAALKKSKFRVFGVGYQVTNSSAPAEFTIPFAKYVRPTDQNHGYVLTFGGFEYRIFTDIVR